jgi:predicted MFS family arabinose efflux permease
MPPNSSASLFTPYQRVVIFLIAVLQFTVVLDFMVLSPLGDVLMKSMHIKPDQFGLVVSAYAFSAGISGFLSASYADRFDRKKLLLVFYTGFILGTLCCALANTYSTLLAARIITGIFGGVIGSISLAIITDIFPLEQRGRVMSYVQMAFAASQILGIPIGIKLSEIYHWHATFYMIVVLSLFIFGIVLWKLKPVQTHLALQQNISGIQHLLHTIKKKTYRIGFAATGLLSIGGFMIMPFTSSFLVNNVGVPEDKLAYVFMATGLSTLFVMPIVGILSDRFSKFRVFLIGSIVASIMVLVYTNLGVMPLAVVIGINMLLFAGIMGRVVPASSLNSAMPLPPDRGAYMSINSSIQQLSGGIGSFVAGHIVHQTTAHSPLQHFDTLGYIMIAIFLVCIPLVYRVHREVMQQRSA